MSISEKLKASVAASATATPTLDAATPTLDGHPPVRSFTTLGGLYYVFDFGGRERTCHESNWLLRRAP